MLSTTNGTVNITGTLTNTGQTLTLPNTGTAWNITGGTISGGNVSVASAPNSPPRVAVRRQQHAGHRGDADVAS